MPQLTPYEAAFYFYLFRHSILSSGTQHVRVKAIRKEAEPNREGTLYKVFIPEEIESCRLAIKERLIAPTPVSDPQAETDYLSTN
jgi:hypothetical protein